MDLSELRLTYTMAGLLEDEVAPDPIHQFGAWMNQAIATEILEPNAMILATANASGQPNARTVLLKSFDSQGFVFYSSYEGRKAREIAENPKVSLLFYWGPLERQVRITGTAAQVPERESDEYFNSRPIGHQIAAWVSRQSSVIADREVIAQNLANVSKRFEPGPVPRPPHWGGFRVKPHVMEFWQGRPNRLHDRLEYVHAADGWTIRRLSP